MPGDVSGVGRPLRWASEIVATASLILLLFNAGAVAGWANELEPGPLTVPAIAAADGWHGFTRRLGLDRPVETMRGRWREAQSARFAGTEPQR
jgi:hypothetical protein